VRVPLAPGRPDAVLLASEGPRVGEGGLALEPASVAVLGPPELGAPAR
jgi:hypothetical protein